VDRQRAFAPTVGGALGVSVAAGVAAGFQSSPSTWQVFCLVVATLTATGAGFATARRPPKKKIMEFNIVKLL
jgi:uncharacterized membrane protein